MEITTDLQTAGYIIIVNTCAFIGDAKEEVQSQPFLMLYSTRMTEIPECLIVTGCLTERYKEEIIKEIPRGRYCNWNRKYRENWPKY